MSPPGRPKGELPLGGKARSAKGAPVSTEKMVRDVLVASGAPFIERVDLLVKLVSDQLGAPSAEIDRTVQTVDQKLNEKIVAGGSGS